MNLVVLLVCCMFAFLRIVLPSEGTQQADIFKDLAHVWVGIILGAAILATNKKLTCAAWLWAAFAGLCIVEVMAVLSHGN